MLSLYYVQGVTYDRYEFTMDYLPSTIQWRADDVLDITATKDELAHILDKFRGLPFRESAATQRWFGDDAKFIVGNW